MKEKKKKSDVVNSFSHDVPKNNRHATAAPVLG